MFIGSAMRKSSLLESELFPKEWNVAWSTVVVATRLSAPISSHDAVIWSFPLSNSIVDGVLTPARKSSFGPPPPPDPGGPVGPAGPVGPVAPPPGPVGPIGPAGPVGPVAPERPVAPVGPVSPAGPVGPVAPAPGPMGPVGPAAPAGPAAPVGPLAPERPAAPARPVGPVGPVAPVAPVVPNVAGSTWVSFRLQASRRNNAPDFFWQSTTARAGSAAPTIATATAAITSVRIRCPPVENGSAGADSKKKGESHARVAEPPGDGCLRPPGASSLAPPSPPAPGPDRATRPARAGSKTRNVAPRRPARRAGSFPSRQLRRRREGALRLGGPS